MPKERILVVDDEEDLLELVGYNLAKEGFRVTTVASGEEAIRRTRTDLPDLIVLDLMLPDVDGLEVCRRLKRTRHLVACRSSWSRPRARRATWSSAWSGGRRLRRQALQPARCCWRA